MLYACRWAGCPRTFYAHNVLLAHLDDEHLTDEALDRECGFIDGRFHDWLKVTGRDGGTQSTSDNWLPSSVVNGSHDQTPSREPRVPDPTPAANLSRISNSPPAVSPKFHFNSVRHSESLGTPTPPIPSPNPSPSPSSLASRRQSHVPDLPSTPSSSSTSPRKTPSEGRAESRSRSYSGNRSQSVLSSRSSQVVELQLTQGEVPASRSSPQDQELDDDVGITGLSESELMKLQEGGSPPNDAVAGEPSEEASERQMPTPPRYDPTTRDSRQPSPVEQHNTPPPIPLSTQEPVRRRTRSQTPQIADPPPPAPPPAGSTHDDPQPDGRVLRRSKRSRSNASPSTVPLSSLAQPTPPVRAQSENPSTKASTAVIAVDPNFLRTGPTRATRASSRARSVERQTQGAPRNTGGRDSKGALAAVQEAQEDEDASSEKLLLPPAITEQSVRPTQRFKSGVLELDRRSRTATPTAAAALQPTSAPQPDPTPLDASQPPPTQTQNPFPASPSPTRSPNASQTQSQSQSQSQDQDTYYPSQMQLLTQKPYHYPSEDSAESVAYESQAQSQ